MDPYDIKIKAPDIPYTAEERETMEKNAAKRERYRAAGQKGAAARVANAAQKKKNLTDDATVSYEADVPFTTKAAIAVAVISFVGTAIGVMLSSVDNGLGGQDSEPEISPLQPTPEPSEATAQSVLEP